MPTHNADIADVFNEIADLLEIKGGNPFRIRAYRNAARTVKDLTSELRTLIEEESDLTELPGIGKDLADKIREILNTGTAEALGKLRNELPREITELLNIPGLGPKRVKALYSDLKITSLAELRKAAEEGRIRKLEGFGEKTEEQIIQSIISKADMSRRYMLASVLPYAEAYAGHLRKVEGVKKVVIAGSYRRAVETIGDIDLLATATNKSPIMDEFTAYDEVSEVLARGKTKSSVTLRTGIQVDLRVVPAKSYGAALHYFTGSKAHNIALRRIGQQKGLKVNEYGVFRGDKQIAGKTETEVYKALDLPYIEPELRENRGEIEAANKGRLPKLVESGDIRGNLHSHTKWSDGHHSIRETAEAAADMGHEYIAVTDHSKFLTVARGLDEKRLREQIEEIDKLNEKINGIAILKGIEVDIMETGELDLPDSVLKDLDIVIGSVHSRFKLSMEKQTERVLKAMDNDYFTMLAHPTGRLLLSRKPYPIDIPRIIKHARERGCYMELNANPQRLDLDDTACRTAREEGVLISINTDAHSRQDMNNMRFGVGQARRAWLEKKDVLNTRPLKELRKLLSAVRR